MTMNPKRTAGMTLTLALGVVTSVSAQLPSASTRALGLGENFTAAARGYHAVAWNPALLGLTSNPRTSLAVLPVRILAGLDPITLSDLQEYESIALPDAVKERWLAAVTAEGSEAGTGGAEITYLALQAGRFALQVSSHAQAVADLSPGAVQLALYGNAGRTGTPENIELTGTSHVDALAASTIAASFAQPFTTSAGTVAVGATVKFTMGHALLFGQDQGSTVTTDPAIELNFPIVTTFQENTSLNHGTGIGLDLGVALEREDLTLSLALQNVFNSFAWSTDNLIFRPATATFNRDTKDATFDRQPYANAPDVLRESIDAMRYKPSIAAGAALRRSQKLLLVADLRAQITDNGINAGPDFHLGAGAEYQIAPLIPLRAGAAVITGGFQFGLGSGIDLGPISLSGGLLRRTTELGTDTIIMTTLLSTMR
jgi:hypothetical protein